MNRTYKLILGMIIKNDKKFFIIFTIYSISFAVYPVLWTLLPETVIKNAFYGSLSELLLLTFFLGVLISFSLFFNTYLRNHAWMRINKIRYCILAKLINNSLKVPYEKSLDSHYLNQLEKARNATINPSIGVGAVMLDSFLFLGNLLASILLLGIIGKLSIIFACLVLISIIVVFLISQKQLKLDEVEWNNSNSEKRKAEKMLDYATDEIHGKDIRIFDLINIIKKYSKKYHQKMINYKNYSRRKKMLFQILINFIEYFREVVVYGWITFNVIEGKIGVGSFLMYTIGVLQLTNCVQQLLEERNTIIKEIGRFEPFFDIERLAYSQVSLNYLDEKESNFDIEFLGVTFAYPNVKTPVLKDFNLKVRNGERIALLGVNGAGKSTIIKLLCRLYTPQEGEILINGRNINSIPDKDYYSKLQVVFQDGMIFPFTVKENITLESSINYNRYLTALDQSMMLGIVKTLPHNDDTFYSHIMSNDGIELSGGEMQRLLLARALYKNSGIFLLDEPSGSMDAIAEEALYYEYDRLTQGKTSMIVSHNLSFVRFCDRIVLIENGKIIEEGTHESLINKRGKYCEMFTLQAKQYA